MKNLIKLLMILGIVFLTSCYDDDDVYGTTCTQTVTSYYSESYYGGIYSGYGQYTVTVVDSYGYYYTYTDATRIPYIGMCW
ncbi:MAG: hypothetical protein GY827_04465 [Cytophagales bacterium]|nr:hypothetical protein [Cytophagales bacterium]